MRRVVESRNLVSFVVSTTLGLYLFRSWPFPVENSLLQLVLLQKPGFVVMLFSTPYIAFSTLPPFTYIFIYAARRTIWGQGLSHHTFRQQCGVHFI